MVLKNALICGIPTVYWLIVGGGMPFITTCTSIPFQHDETAEFSVIIQSILQIPFDWISSKTCHPISMSKKTF
jgi:hypothetical protein